MSGKKKNGHKKSQVEKVLLITAFLNLIKALIDLISNLIE